MDTKNEDIIEKYFDIVQDKIKKLISEDNEIKPEQVQQFNDEIFNQPEEIEGQMKNYINKATMNDLDIDRVAKIIYDKFKLQVKNNIFNQKDAQPVPNPMLGERKFIKTFENWLTSRPRILKSEEEFKYLDDNGNIRYCKYIRDELLRGETGLLGGILGTMSIVDDEKEGRIHIKKDRLLPLTEIDFSTRKYNL